MIDNTADATSATEVKALHTLETETAAAGVKDEVPTTIEDSTTAIKEKEMKKELSERAGGKEIAAEKRAWNNFHGGYGKRAWNNFNGGYGKRSSVGMSKEIPYDAVLHNPFFFSK